MKTALERIKENLTALAFIVDQQEKIEYLMMKYAEDVAEQALKDAAQNATAFRIYKGTEKGIYVQKQSILNTEIKTP